MLNLKALLQQIAETDASDLHLKVGAPPLARIDGALRRLNAEVLMPEDTELIARSIIPPDRRDRLEDHKEVDFALSLAGVGRFRVNIFHQRGSVSLVLRRVRQTTPSFEELGLPPVVKQIAEAPRGLILVTGPTGSGKTTTLASVIDYINATKPLHILTIEDPIEVLHRDRMGVVNQREVAVDTDSFVDAMRAAVREDPDVILIGEMRDSETVAAALAAAETGHLVLSTLHTKDAVETVNRVVDFFPPYQQHQARVSLSSVLDGVMCQRLLPKIGGGRVLAAECLVNNGRVAERLVDPLRTHEIHELMQKGESWGMQTFDQALVNLVRAGLVTVEEALNTATNAHDLHLMLQQAGLVRVTAATA